MENKQVVYSELQKSILKCFYDLQCNEDTGLFNDDETPAVNYYYLTDELKLSKNQLIDSVLELRNMQLIMLVYTVNCDYIPAGSGYVLTEKKGADLVKELFFKEEPDTNDPSQFPADGNDMIDYKIINNLLD